MSEKSKNKAKPRSYRHNWPLIAIGMALVISLFFMADAGIGAIILRKYYNSIGFQIGFLLGLIGLLVFTPIWIRNGGQNILSGILKSLVALLPVSMIIGMTLVGGKSSTRFNILLGFLIFAVGLWLWAKRRNHYYTTYPMIPIAIMAFYIAGMIALNSFLLRWMGYTDLDIRSFNQHVYYADTEMVSTGDSAYDYPINLYECNRIGLFCEKIYSQSYGWNYPAPDVKIEVEGNLLKLIKNGETLFTLTSQDQAV